MVTMTLYVDNAYIYYLFYYIYLFTTQQLYVKYI